MKNLPAPRREILLLSLAISPVAFAQQCDLSGCTKLQIAKAYVKATEGGSECNGDNSGSHTATATCSTEGCTAQTLLDSFGTCGINPTCATAIGGDAAFCTGEAKVDKADLAAITCAQDPCTTDECCDTPVSGAYKPLSHSELKTKISQCLEDNSFGTECYVCAVDGELKTSASDVCSNDANPTFISDWDTSEVTSFKQLFESKGSFNQDISKWDTSKVTNMQETFEYAFAFNQDISTWDVSSVTTFNKMFQYTNAFNQDIRDWNVESGGDFNYMFQNAGAFNQDLSCWQEHFKSRLYSSNLMNMFYGNTANTQTYCWTQATHSNTFTGTMTKDTSCTPQKCNGELYQQCGNLDQSFCNEGDMLNPDTTAAYCVGDVCTPEADYNTCCTPFQPAKCKSLLDPWINANSERTAKDWDRKPIASFCPAGQQWSYAKQENECQGMNCDSNNAADHVACCEPLTDTFTPQHGIQLKTAIGECFSSSTDYFNTGDDCYICPDMTRKTTDSDVCAYGGPGTHLSDWDVSNVEIFYYAFANKRKFNQPVKNWDVSNGKDFGSMFYYNEEFNQDLSCWGEHLDTTLGRNQFINMLAYAKKNTYKPCWGPEWEGKSMIFGSRSYLDPDTGSAISLPYDANCEAQDC